ncbi:MAG: hypothetical protein WAO08_01825 [Hyphomicrobiaceae bacterium]
MMRLNDRLTGALAAAVLVVATSSAQAQCNTIGGKGTGGSLESARFQAYEAMLQGTDVGMWANWMVTGAKVGVAPGYTVDGLKFRCAPGGMGQECRARAKFCKKA